MQGNDHVQGGPQVSPAIIVSDTNTLIPVAAMRTNAAVVTGLLGGVAMEMMLDSGSAVSLVRKDMMSSQMNNVTQIPLPAVKLVTAAGDDLLMIDHIQTTVQIQHHTVNYMFVMVNTLITPAILGMDFLQQHGIVIDFASTPVKIFLPPATENNTDPILRPILQTECNRWTKHCAIVSLAESKEDQVEDYYTIPLFSQTPSVEFPECRVGNLQTVVYEFQQLFQTSPGKTDASYHYIPTIGPPVHVTQRYIPIHYRKEVLKQL